jgi:hypothetical protein
MVIVNYKARRCVGHGIRRLISLAGIFVGCVLNLAMRRHKSIAKVAMGRRLAIRLYWMWRNGCEYSQSLEFGSYAGQLGTGHGVK